MKYEFFPVTRTKSNTKPPKLPKGLSRLTVDQWCLIYQILKTQKIKKAVLP